MLPRNLSMFVCALLMISMAALSGCMSTSPSASAAPGRSVIAGDTTFVEVTTGQGPPTLVSYTEQGKTVCPECKAVATKYFETGVLDESVCKTCGSHLYLGQGELLQPK